MDKLQTVSVGMKCVRLAEHLGMSAQDLADALGVDRTTVYSYKRRSNANPSPQSVQRLRQYLRAERGYDPGTAWFFDTEDTAPPDATQVRSTGGAPVATMPMVPVRVVGTAGAGVGVNADPGPETIFVPANMGSNIDRLAHIVEGDSMMPFLEPGDVGVFREMRWPRPKKVFLLKDAGGYLIKQVVYERDRFVGRSLNPRYEDLELDGVELVGMLVGIYRSVGSYERMEYDSDGLGV